MTASTRHIPITKTQTITPKQYDFVKRYVSNGFNAKQAAIDVGYSETFASTDVYALLTKPVIKQHVETAQAVARDNYVKKIGATQEFILNVLMRIIKDAVPDDANVSRPAAKDALKAVEIMNKMLGYNAPEKRVSMTMNITRQKIAEIKREYEDY